MGGGAAGHDGAGEGEPDHGTGRRRMDHAARFNAPSMTGRLVERISSAGVPSCTLPEVHDRATLGRDGLRSAAPSDTMMDFGQVVFIDRSKRAIAARFELSLDRDTAQEWLELAPDVLTEDLVSWGRVSPAQINGLLDLCGDHEGAEIFAELVARHAASDTFISLFWYSDKSPAHGE